MGTESLKIHRVAELFKPFVRNGSTDALNLLVCQETELPKVKKLQILARAFSNKAKRHEKMIPPAGEDASGNYCISPSEIEAYAARGIARELRRRIRLLRKINYP